MSSILITMNEDAQATCPDSFGVTYKVDEHDCLHYAAGLEALGHDVFFVNWDDLRGGQFARMFSHTEKRFVEPVSLEAMDLIWVYQMEGFYGQLSRFLEMVGVFENACARVINDPGTIRHNLGKQYLWALEEQGVRVIPTYRVDDEIVRRLAAGERFVLKPLYGERGKDIFLATTPEDLARITSHEEQYIAQEYIPGVRDGERSLMFLGFDYQHAVLKRPSSSNTQEFRCNESLGGTVSIYEPTSGELAYADGVLRAYESLGYPVHYSRIDFLCTPDGPLLMEAELLNPAAFANYSGKGAAFGRSVANYLHGVLAMDAERQVRQSVR
jgi:glutathione synthase/RimK-type ligase-like ATP-grasp enzyme